MSLHMSLTIGCYWFVAGSHHTDTLEEEQEQPKEFVNLSEYMSLACSHVLSAEFDTICGG